VAKDIGNVTVVDKNHPSIIEINNNKKDIPNLEFKERYRLSGLSL
jgi:hypothetical protein